VVIVTALDLTSEHRRRLNGRVKAVLSKTNFAPAESMARVGTLLSEGRNQAKRQFRR
jgi:hypothetical protein